ncbi:SGNH/GDSL hydrolase family protein [Rubrivivax gelatinosus]|uniref:SGNH/GDSL hydrolase family protein n=1 Tax=Rubrivivax gelatinosus TaxID=28068 RepID=UPI0005C24C45|nr:SGNH/GDSL hydrolase family protein [Rubrivivax gelatinosus]MBG6080433.1 phospholipase/lecithinase/hemolysin [Rubrivivax gelatinosus]
MKMRRGVLAAAISAALLAACGGGSNPDPASEGPSGAPTTVGAFSAVVSFGDSLSDVGTYAPATSLAGNGTAPYFGGKFTTNTDSATGDLIWIERVAATLGITITPADVGFAGSSVACPAALQSAALAGTCTAYGQGGSRVTDPNGIGHTKNGAPAALTVPVSTQIDHHLARFGSFKDTDLVIVWAGNNDAFIQLQTFVATAQAIQAKVAAGELTADQGNKQLYDAQSAAQEGMKEAAHELAGYVKTKILAHGGKYVAIGNLPNSALTPQFQAYPASIQGVLTTLTETFNLWLKSGLDGQPVQIIDMAAIGAAAYNAPATYGFTNITTPACSAAKISAITGGQVTDGSSLFCNATTGMPYNGLTTGADPATWFFADGVHPTSGGHAYYAQQVLEQLRKFGWVAAAQ